MSRTPAAALADAPTPGRPRPRLLPPPRQWCVDGGQALIRKTIRELADELDPERFVQVHRSAIVCLDRVSHFTHGSGDGGELHLQSRKEPVPVSRSYLHLFQQM